MKRDPLNPALLVGLAMLMLLTGGFFTVLHVGMSARQNKGMSHGFSFRGAALAVSTYVEDLERGSKIVKSRSAALFDEYFGSGSIAYPPEGAYASSRGAYGPGGEVEGQYSPEESAFDKYYQDNYGSGSSDYSPSSSYGGGVGTFAGGGSGGSSQETSPAAAGTGKAPEEKTAAAGEASPRSEAAAGAFKPASGPNLGGPAAAPKLYAALPAKGTGRAYSGPPASGGAPGEFAGTSKTSALRDKGAGLDAFKGGGAAKGLDGGAEGARSGSESSYNSKMGGGAAAAASAGSGSGGSAPAASGPEKTEAGAGGAAAPAATADTEERSSSSGYEEDRKYTAFGDQPADPQDFLKTIVTERRNGAEVKYVSDTEASGELADSLLQSGAAAAEAEEDGGNEGGGGSAAPRDDRDTRDTRRIREIREDGKKRAVTLEPDPEDFSMLPAERKLKIKKRIHIILRRVERYYGAMSDISYTSCASAREICEEHGLTQNFLTMTTVHKAELSLGVKHVRKRWRPYTIDFKDPLNVVDRPDPQAGEYQWKRRR